MADRKSSGATAPQPPSALGTPLWRRSLGKRASDPNVVVILLSKTPGGHRDRGERRAPAAQRWTGGGGWPAARRTRPPAARVGGARGADGRRKVCSVEDGRGRASRSGCWRAGRVVARQLIQRRPSTPASKTFAPPVFAVWAAADAMLASALISSLQPTRDMGRFVRWPRYIRVQRQRKVLYQRLKVPPSINQFKRTLEKNQAAELFRLLSKYSPETRAEKRARLMAAAEAGGASGDGPGPVLKFGLNHVTTLIEQKKAQLVVIAADVDPIELVVWLPALCRRMDIPYMIVNNKGRLGTLVHQKRTAVVALTEVNKEDRAKFESLQEIARSQYNDAVDSRRTWGGGIMGLKTQKALEIRARQRRAEEEKKAMY